MTSGLKDDDEVDPDVHRAPQTWSSRRIDVEMFANGSTAWPCQTETTRGRRNLSFNVIICVIYYQHVRCSLPSFSAGVTEDRLWPSCSAEFINQGAQFIRATRFINTFAELSKR